MERIEIELKDLFRNRKYLDMLLSNLNSTELYQLIGYSVIELIRYYCKGNDIDLSKPKEFKDVINRIWKNVEKELLLSYNNARK